MKNYVKFETVSLKNRPDYNENWVQQQIVNDPSILGLGSLSVIKSEKIQQSGGRVDVLLQDEGTTRYVVELQLGKVDESHIIRTIEYWDNERKRNKTYNHVAVIIAEDITNRFFNVISLFNGSIPIIAIQLKAVKHNNDWGLVFTTVLDAIFPDDDGEEIGELTDRPYWENLGTKVTVKMADKLLAYINGFLNGDEFSLKYNKFYIGLATRNGVAKNFASFVPKKAWIQLRVKLKKADDIDVIVEKSGLDSMPYDTGWKEYRFRLTEKDLINCKDDIVVLLKMAYESFTGSKIVELQDVKPQ